jgi:integrase
MALTELSLKNLKPKNKRYLVRDDQGLYIEINPTGRKYWKVRYMVDGSAKKVTLGEYPYITLKEARQKRDEVRGMIAAGEGPQSPFRTFRDVASEWYGTHIKGVRSDRHAETVISRLQRFLYPRLGDKTIKNISAPDVLDILRALQNSGIVETAHRVKQIAGQVFRYAVAIGEGEHDVTAALRGALKPNGHGHHGAAKTPQETRAVILAIDAYKGGSIVKNALWFSAYTFARPGEVRHAEWAEIDFEAEEWRIPAEKMKARKVHLVPLASQVMSILEDMKTLTGHGRYIFPSPRAYKKGDVPMSENAVTSALRRMGFEKDQMTAHGFRTMASTNFNEARKPDGSRRWDKDAIERQLAHVEGNSVRDVYNYAEYLPERREMMQWWADWLEGLR